MATSATINCGITINRTLTTGVTNATNPNITLAVGENTQLTSATTPDVEYAAAPLLTLTAGAKTVDLTALSDVNGGTLDLTGKKVRALFFHNLSTTNNMTFAKGASNGLDSLSGSWTMTLLPLEKRCIDLTDVAVASIAAISASIKNIDVSGTGTDTFDFGVVVG